MLKKNKICLGINSAFVEMLSKIMLNVVFETITYICDTALYLVLKMKI
jgi:hypothetical protein